LSKLLSAATLNDENVAEEINKLVISNFFNI